MQKLKKYSTESKQIVKFCIVFIWRSEMKLTPNIEILPRWSPPPEKILHPIKGQPFPEIQIFASHPSPFQKFSKNFSPSSKKEGGSYDISAYGMQIAICTRQDTQDTYHEIWILHPHMSSAQLRLYRGNISHPSKKWTKWIKY